MYVPEEVNMCVYYVAAFFCLNSNYDSLLMQVGTLSAIIGQYLNVT